MADNDDIKDDPKDEYQYTEIDPLNSQPSEDELAGSDATYGESPATKDNVKRNAIIAIGVFIAIVVIYKFMGSSYEEKKIDIVKAPTALTPLPPSPSESKPTSVPETVLPAVGTPVQTSEVQTKLTSLEANQESMRTDLSSFNAQVMNMNTTITSLSAKIADLTTTINALNDKLESHALEISRLTVKPIIKSVRTYGIKKQAPHVQYFIQAVIPGRAWLVATNGRTLTVREGSSIPGYGVVRLIDPSQGRILTSSGRMIRFSQDDS